ncbi:myelin protein zero-like protein 2b [Cyprinus carpio]|uniref:Myelin protein zero-like protein 2b n=1 Tax=Cyprinus carpio TaxID=7962 RepID=A0A9Q9W9K2_CYPCA|nr:myelin protein zero-like protein 2b [Cyprinus carpio]
MCKDEHVNPWLSGVHHVEGMELLTSLELETVNGTDVQLKCTFKSTHPLSEDNVSVSWRFRPLRKMTEENFYYQKKSAFPPETRMFKGHVWSGDIMKGDASITLQNVQFRFNGTYSCQVKNPADIQGFVSEIRLKILLKVSFSEIGILAIAVGGSIGVVLLLLIIYIVVRIFQRQDDDTFVEMENHKSKYEVL